MTDSLADLRRALGSAYQVERELGQGGMASVYLATDTKHRRRVAVKVLRPELAVSIGPDRFLREIEIAATLQHPNIVPLYDSGQADTLLYYVMPFVEGESLRERIAKGGPLPATEAVRITREVADALDYAHRQQIVHRDIKPANILLSQGHAMVADFGIARAVSASAKTGMTQVGMSLGTPTYMSPEQALGGSDVDARADVFALGVTLFETLEGTPPFEGNTPQAIIAKTVSGQHRRLSRDPHGLQPIIDRALASDPAARYATAAEFGAALGAAMAGDRSAARMPARRTMVAAAAVVMLAVAGFGVWSRYGAIEDPRKSLIIFPFENRTGDAARDYLEEASMNLLGLAASHWADMRVFDDERTASLLRRRQISDASALDFEAARSMARDAGVGTLVLGDIRREGDSLAVEAKVHDVRSGERLVTNIVRGALTDDPRPMFERLAAQLLGIAGAPLHERPSLLAQTTSSLEAYRAYLDGTSALQRFAIDSARALLERAISLDSSFALAYIRLRDVDGWAGPSGDEERRRQLVLAAERHGANLPPRLRTLVEFHRAYEDRRFWRARRIAEALIARDSTDVEAWYQLGEAHFHDRATHFPRPDTAGNMGTALRTFQRALALDSAYILAYQHILDALRSCAHSGYWACLADSAVYGRPEDLERRFGAESFATIRRGAAAEMVETARGWVSAAPAAPRARYALVHILFSEKRFDEAEREADALARAGARGQAGIWSAQIALMRGRPGEAAAAYDGALRTANDSFPIFGDQQTALLLVNVYAGGGQLAAARRYIRMLFGRVEGDSLGMYGNQRVSIAEAERFTYTSALLEAGVEQGARELREEIRAIARRVGRDSLRFRHTMTALGGPIVAAFLATRDTSLLAQFLSATDTTASATWRVAAAQLALARGDTSAARMRIERHYATPAEVEFRGEQGIVRSFAWGDLLARAGAPKAAIEAFARIDSSEARTQHAGFMARSYAERGALYEQIGDVDNAIRYYERFIEAWTNADAGLRPAVELARRRVLAVKDGAILSRR